MKYLKPFEPTHGKLRDLATRLMNDYLYLDDNFRDYNIIWKILTSNFIKKDSSRITWEIGNFDGLIGFHDIIPDYKGEVGLKIWNRTIWGPTLAREIRELVHETMRKYNLKRLSSSSPDKKMAKFAEIMGFKTEGRFKNDFRWNKKLYTLHKLRILREEV